MQQTFDINRRLSNWMSNIKEWKIDKTSIENKFKKTKTGLYIAYCNKCGNKNYPNDYQLKQQSCCGVEYSPDPIEPDKYNQPEKDAEILSRILN